VITLCAPPDSWVGFNASIAVLHTNPKVSYTIQLEQLGGALASNVRTVTNTTAMTLTGSFCTNSSIYDATLPVRLRLTFTGVYASYSTNVVDDYLHLQSMYITNNQTGGILPFLGIDGKEVLRVSYRISDSPYIEAGSIDFKPLQNAVADYANVIDMQCCSAMQTGMVYWQALRDLGFRDVAEVTALIPMPDLVLPENIFDISGTDVLERYAMYVAYLKSSTVGL
jgi:hypothetical protein